MTAALRQAPDRYRLRVADYLMLDRSGAFDRLRTELIEGEVLVMSPQFRPHGMMKLALYDRLRDALRTIESPLRPVMEFSLALGDDSMPEPDIMLTNEPSGEGAVPLRSVALVIEVADTTLDHDLGTKAALYARSGIPEYWMANLAGGVLHQMWGPAAHGYADHHRQGFGTTIRAVTLPVSIALPER